MIAGAPLLPSLLFIFSEPRKPPRLWESTVISCLRAYRLCVAGDCGGSGCLCGVFRPCPRMGRRFTSCAHRGLRCHHGICHRPESTACVCGHASALQSAADAGLLLLNTGCLLRVSSEILAYENYWSPAWKDFAGICNLRTGRSHVFALNLLLTFKQPPAHAICRPGYLYLS